MALDDAVSYIFGTKPDGTLPTYGQLQTRRKIAETIAGQRSPYPKTIGEGLSAIGDALAYRGQMSKWDAAEAARGQYEQGVLRSQGLDPNTLQPLATPPATPPVVPTPDPRKQVTDAIMDQNTRPVQTAALTAPEVPQENPTSRLASLSAGGPDRTLTMNAEPGAGVPQGTVITGLPPAPPVQQPQIQKAPVQVAGNDLNQLRAPTTEPLPPAPPQPTPTMRSLEAALSVVGDPLQRSVLTQRYNQEAADQKALYDQQMEIYRHKRDLWETAPRLQQEFTKSKAEADVATRTGGLGNEPLLAPVIKSAETVKGLPAAAQALRNARDNLEKGIYSGAFADQHLAYAKTKEMIGGMFGIDASDPKIANTEAFKASIMPLVAQMRSAVSGNANISDADINLALQAAGGQLTLDAKTFPRVLEALERINTATAISHQQRVLGAAAGNATAGAALQGVYGLPMEDIIPQRFIQRLREHPEAASEFDAKFKTPGLAARILGR